MGRPSRFSSLASTSFPSWLFPSGSGGDLQSSKRVCRLHFTVDDKDTVTTNGVCYVVPWGARNACSWQLLHVYARCAKLECLPTSSDVHDRLSITSVVPFSHCSVCDGGCDGVFGWWKQHSLRGGWLFFLRKSGLPSHACGREQFLLKPTCFHEVRRRRSVRAKTSMSQGVVLLDHWFHRNITQWLIPRFVQCFPL